MKLSAARLFALVTTALLILIPTVRGQTTATVTTIYNFNVVGSNGDDIDGQNPQAALVQGNDGNFYGTTYGSVYVGDTDYGMVFSITPAGVLTTLHSFSAIDSNGDNTDGAYPLAALVQGSDGNFYGTTIDGGSNGVGTIFSVTSAGVFTTLYSFTGGGDGANPMGALIQGSDGNLYGTNTGGGIGGSGTVFTITPAGVFTTFYTFSGGDGISPVGGLIVGTDGNFYGTTQLGGGGGYGTAFSITPAGALTTLYSFATGTENVGVFPSALVQGSDGNFYGTTNQGGSSGDGTVFSMTPAGAVTILHTFTDVPDGSSPDAGLVQGSDGNFYGTTTIGGYGGTIYSITPAGAYTTLSSFSGFINAGEHPNAALVQGSDGNFYGTTRVGGSNDGGTVFRLSLTSSPGTILFAPVTYNTTENAGSVMLTVQRTGGSTGAVTVDYATSDGNAAAGIDYQTISGTLSWGNGDTIDKTITIPIIDRQIYDGSTKSFTVTLTNPTGGATDGTVPTATVNIIDSDIPPTPTPPPTSTPTPVSAPVITSAASVSAQINLPFTYQITASNSPTSYAASGLPAGLSVDATGGLISGTPTTAGVFAVGLSATNAGGSGNGKLTLTLEAPAVNAAAGGSGMAVEGGAAGVVTVTRTGDTSTPLTVSYKVKGAAKPGVDYKKLSGSITIAAGATKAKIKVKPIDGSPNTGTLKIKVVLVAPSDGSYTVGTGTAKIKLIGK